MKFQAWINGKPRDGYEVVKPVVSRFGPAGTQCPLLIGSRIDFVRSGIGGVVTPLKNDWIFVISQETLQQLVTRHRSSCSRGKSCAASILADERYNGHIFEEPKVSVSRRVAAFMFGNGVIMSDAAKFYRTCHAAWRNVSETRMYGWYLQWAK